MNEKGISVLEEYPLEVYSVRKGRGILIADTSEGLKKLVEFKGMPGHADFQNQVQEKLWEQAGIKTDRFVKNRDNQLITIDKDGRKYVLKEHVQGSECDLKSEQDIIVLVQNLARLHKHLRLRENLQQPPEFFSRQLLEEEFEKHNRELRKIRKFIRKRSSNSDFENRFLKEFELFYSQGEEALELLKKSDGKRLTEESILQGLICHGDYNYHNVLLEKKGSVTVNFEKCHVGIQMEDLYHFMRKILEKNNWDIRLGRRIFTEYSNVRSISRAERENLYIRLKYPEKFWKLANQYYNSNKAWISGKTIEKLEITAAQNQHKQEFLWKFKDF
ncbi:MAG: CotS family spore coat protein [Lachnospiraceae bacterium]|nr:CotS family spore coat protein [Lachnospiraceae bacterium]